MTEQEGQELVLKLADVLHPYVCPDHEEYCVPEGATNVEMIRVLQGLAYVLGLGQVKNETELFGLNLAFADALADCIETSTIVFTPDPKPIDPTLN